jgi:hypothetical protein
MALWYVEIIGRLLLTFMCFYIVVFDTVALPVYVFISCPCTLCVYVCDHMNRVYMCVYYKHGFVCVYYYTTVCLYIRLLSHALYIITYVDVLYVHIIYQYTYQITCSAYTVYI